MLFSLLTQCFALRLARGAHEWQMVEAELSSAALSCGEKSLLALIRHFIFLSLTENLFEQFQRTACFIQLTRLLATRPLTDHDKYLLSVVGSGGHLFAVGGDRRFAQQ